MNKKMDCKDFRLVMRFMKKKAPFYFSFMIINNAIVSICYNIVLSVILKDVVDAIAFHDINLIKRAFLIAILSFIIAFIFEPITMKIVNYCVRSTMRKVRHDTFNRMEEVRVNIYEKFNSGDLLSRITKDVNALEDVFLKHIPNLSFSIIHGTFAIVLMIYLNLFLGSLAILLGLASVFANYLISKKIKIYSTEYQKESGNLSQNILDIEDGFIDLKMSSSEEYFFNKFKKITRKLQYNYEMREKFNIVLETVSILVGNMNRIGLMALGLYMVFQGNTTVGIVVSVIRLQGNASYLFQNLSNFIGGVQKALPSARRVFEIYEMKVENHSDSNLSNRMDRKADKTGKKLIDIKNLIFSYDERNNVLNGISMSIKHGEFIGIEGESGNGKSSFMKILLGFYQPASGTYILNKKNMNDSNIVELREQIAYVDQDCHLFQQTIEENIRFGNQKATKEEMIEACKLANAHDFIMSLKDGYQTKINETGDNISGGQRQRIALARALVSNREILFIDEGTASLDAEAEKQVTNTLQSLKGKKTIIVISHNPSVIECADRKYKFIAGKIG